MRLRLTHSLALVAVISLSPIASQAASPWIYGKQPMVATPLDTVLAKTWSGIKKRNIQPWTGADGLVHRPKSETPGDAVSEGQAYGMIVALYQNDQTAFNGIWDAAENKMWNANSSAYDWRYNSGKITATGMAPDADEDIALMLIFADALVSKGIWTAHASPKGGSYSARAQSIVTSIWNNAINHDNFALRPAPGWGGGGTCTNGKDNWPCGDFLNPGYLSPASYRIFKDFDPSHQWGSVIDASYRMLAANAGNSKGLLLDWMTTGGQAVPGGGLGYNPFLGGQAFYKDAIRIHWRLAMDYLWFQEPRAKSFLDNAYSFVARDPAKANFYKMDGSLVPVESTFTLTGTVGPTRSRREHSPLTIGMWACAAMGSGGADSADAWAKELMSHYTPGSDFWGLAKDPLGGVEDTAHNEMYFDQFLAWFGASVLAGRFTNILADLNASDASTALAWKTGPSLSSATWSLDKPSLQITGSLTKAAAWAVEVRHKSSALTWSATGVGSSLDLAWKGVSRTGVSFPAGDLEVRIRVRGIPDSTLDVDLYTGVKERMRHNPVGITTGPGGLLVHSPATCALRVRDVGGKLLLATTVGAGTSSIDLAAHGLVLVETEMAGLPRVQKVLLGP